jgi:alpha-L-arabinofuranosidase
LINRHFSTPVSVHLRQIAGFTHAHGQLLYADQPRAVNSVEQPDNVTLTPLAIEGRSHEGWRVDLPPHSIATIILQAQAEG